MIKLFAKDPRHNYKPDPLLQAAQRPSIDRWMIGGVKYYATRKQLPPRIDSEDWIEIAW